MSYDANSSINEMEHPLQGVEQESHISVIWANSWLYLRQFNSHFIAQVEGHPPMGSIRHTRVIGIDPIE